MSSATLVGIRETGQGDPPTEHALSAIWQRSHTLATGLETEDGIRLRVIYPGRSNHGAGPDFLDAVIESESGHVFTGDVELHLRAPDWYGHRHDTDPHYNGVVLHAVLWPKGHNASRQQSGTVTPVVSLATSALEFADDNVASQDESLPGPIRPGARELGRLLDRAGDRRFCSRNEGIAREIKENNPEQALYSALMEALGYASNRKPFRVLAERVPIGSVRRLRDEPSTTRLLAIKAMLIGTAGLFQYLEYSRQVTELKRLFTKLGFRGQMPGASWRLFRVRPSNHPVRRLEGAAHLLDRHLEKGLLRALRDLVMTGGHRELVEQLAVRPFIGIGRASDMAVNVVLPFLHAYAGQAKNRALRDRCIALYNDFPRLEENEVTREMRRLLGIVPSDRTVTGARRQQGLIHLYKESYVARGL